MSVPSSSQPQEETVAAEEFISSKFSFQKKKCEWIAGKKIQDNFTTENKTTKKSRQPTKHQTKPNQK